jgi:hypothetical protein
MPSQEDRPEARARQPACGDVTGTLADRSVRQGHVGSEGDINRDRSGDRSADTESVSKRSPVLPGFVKRAEAFIDACCSEPLELLDIASAIGVSARTLRDGFQQFRGVSPMQYVRQVRLERAREALRMCVSRRSPLIAGSRIPGVSPWSARQMRSDTLRGR